MRHKLFFLGLLIGCLGLAVWLFREPRNNSAGITRAEEITPRPVQPVQHSAPAANSVPTVSSSALPHPLMTGDDLGHKYLQARNLADFIAENSANAESGNGKAARLIAAAYSECSSVGKSGDEYVAFMMETVGSTLKTSDKKTQYKNALNGRVSRCSSLIESPLPVGSIKYWNDIALREGDLSEMARNLSSAKTRTAVENLVSQIISASDGDAMAQLGSVMAMAPPTASEIYGRYSGQPSSAYVWQLAACSFGADCSASGQLLRDMCLSSGLCEYASLANAYRDLFSPLEYNEINGEALQLVSTLKSGNVSRIYN